MSRISYLSELLSTVLVRDQKSHINGDRGTFFELADALLSQRGEMSGNRLARGLLDRFAIASDQERLEFFQMLATRFDINAEHAVRAAQRYAKHKDANNLSILMESVEPRRQELLRRLNRVPGATHELVQMRTSLLKMCKEHPELKCIDVNFLRLFRSWFNQGFLVMHEIDWHSPAIILEKIIAYEAVHAINNWSELRSRLEPEDRRCFAFFHPAMLDEPLIFVEVALTESEPAFLSDVLAADRKRITEDEATTAVFYSISNCQKGLSGVSFGNFLIKQVARELSRELPGLEKFRTLSPVPDFMRWVNGSLKVVQASESLEASEDLLHEGLRTARRVSCVGSGNEIAEKDLEKLQSLVAHYLVNEKRGDLLPLDSVARFHLGNGASLDAILPGADLQDKGLGESAGTMVSYLYNLEKVENNHEVYANDQKVIISSAVKNLLRGQRRNRKRS